MTEEFKTVILIDNDELSNYVSEKAIKINKFAKNIFTFLTAKGAFSFLEKAAENNEFIQYPAVIFLDIDMPDLDGWDFLHAYRILPHEFKERCRLFILSSSVDERDFLKAKSYREVCSFLSKPLDKEILDIIRIGKVEVL